MARPACGDDALPRVVLAHSHRRLATWLEGFRGAVDRGLLVCSDERLVRDLAGRGFHTQALTDSTSVLEKSVAWDKARCALRAYREGCRGFSDPSLNTQGASLIEIHELGVLYKLVYVEVLRTILGRLSPGDGLILGSAHLGLLSAPELLGVPVQRLGRPLKALLPRPIRTAIRATLATWRSISKRQPARSATGPSSGKPTVLMTVGDAAGRTLNADTALPVAQAVQRNGGDVVVAVDAEHLVPWFAQRGLPAVPLGYDAPTLDDFRLLRDADTALRVREQTLSNDAAAYSRLLRLEIDTTWFRTRSLLRGLGELLHRTAPTAVLALSDRSPIGRAAVALATTGGIPTLTASTCMVADHPMYGALHADRIAASGVAPAAMYVRRGNLGPGRAVPCGLAAGDTLVNRPVAADRLQVSNELAMDPAGQFILFATEGVSFSRTAAYLRPLAQHVTAGHHRALVVKVHPGESADLYTEFLADLSCPRLRIVKDYPIAPLIGASRVVIVGESTVGALAVLADRDLVAIRLHTNAPLVPYAASGAAVTADEPETLPSTVDRVLKGDVTESLRVGRLRFIDSWLHAADGRAADRVATLCLDARSGSRPDSAPLAPVAGEVR